MKKLSAFAFLLFSSAAMAQTVVPADQHRYLEQASQQTISELTSAIVNLRATLAQVQDENAKLRAELTKPKAAEDAPK